MELPDTGTLLGAVATEGARVAALPIERLDAPVPGLTDWTVERVVRHLGRVHRWVTGLLAAPGDADPATVSAAAPSLPRGPACLEAYADSLDQMLASFATAAPDRPVASFAGPADVAFWARRQAHEVTVHRVDAQDAVHAAGGAPPAPLDPPVAADGVGEWLEVFASAQRPPASSPLRGRRIECAVTDPVRGPSRWVLHYTQDGTGSTARAPAGVDTPQVRLAGPAGTLLLTLWRRRPLETVSVTGQVALAAALLDTVRV